MKSEMRSYDAYNAQAVNEGNVWVMFLLLGWSYGSMNQMVKQVFYYLTLGGCGIWTLYRLFTLSGAIKKYNKGVAVRCGMSTEDMLKLELI